MTATRANRRARRLCWSSASTPESVAPPREVRLLAPGRQFSGGVRVLRLLALVFVNDDGSDA